jgi:hypothetical protein
VGALTHKLGDLAHGWRGNQSKLLKNSLELIGGPIA